jgi:hypothetical protein
LKEEEEVKRIIIPLTFIIIALIVTSCSFSVADNSAMENTRVALAIQQTSLAMDQTRAVQSIPPTNTQEPPPLPTYTPYPTYTSEMVVQPTAEQQPIETEPPVEEQPTEEAVQSFEDWLEDVDILLYDDMLSLWEEQVIENAIDGLGLGRNTKNVGDAMGNFLSEMNSAITWDLIIVGAESRTNISGEYFDILADQIDRGSSIIIEIWYIDNVASGRIQPLMQRCGISFQDDWWRDPQDNLNDFLVYLLEPSDPLFSQPNLISLLAPYDIMWIDDIGDLVKINSGSNAKLLGGVYPKRYTDYGLLAECLEGRMVWQLFSTHDYKTQEMINLWQNYIYNTLQARYEYLNN